MLSHLYPNLFCFFLNYFYPTVVILLVLVAGVENKIFIWVLAALDMASPFMRSATLSVRFLTYSRVIFGSNLIFNLTVA